MSPRFPPHSCGRFQILVKCSRAKVVHSVATEVPPELRRARGMFGVLLWVSNSGRSPELLCSLPRVTLQGSSYRTQTD